MEPGPAIWAILAVLATASSAAGCYKPDVANGKLLCPANTCPDGFSCVMERCWRGGVVIPPDGGGLDTDPGVDMSDTEVACAQPLCTPAASTGVCDPTCQTGCGCREKCSISSAGEAACVPILGSQGPAQSCKVNDYGAPAQNDNCAPGSVCLYPGGSGSQLSYCFGLCASDDTCPNSRCVPRPVAPAPAPGIAPPTADVCDVPFTACDPLATSNNGCPPDRPVCYLETPDPATGASRTVCEYFAGAGRVSDTCGWSRDCSPRFVCPSDDDGVARLGVGFCLSACDSTHLCSLGSCKPYGSTYGYCVTN